MFNNTSHKMEEEMEIIGSHQESVKFGSMLPASRQHIKLQ